MAASRRFDVVLAVAMAALARVVDAAPCDPPCAAHQRCDNENNPTCISVPYCDQTCANGGTCTESNRGGSCECAPGWKGPTCAQPTGCDSNPCGSHGTCTASGASHSCSCEEGWSGRQDCAHGTGCDGHPCGSHGGTCTPNGGSHSCTCEEGWKDDQDCSSPTGCDNSPCGSHVTKCTPDGGKHSCSCEEGWTGGQSCTCTNSCPSQKPDSNAAAACPSGKCLSETCPASCRDGFYGTDGTYSCQLDGSWKAGPALSCTVQTCSIAPTPHSKPCSGKFEDQKTCTVVCVEGYTNKPGAGGDGYTCEANGNEEAGTWTGTETCAKKICDPANPTSGQCHPPSLH
jgi:hypothetical protein